MNVRVSQELIDDCIITRDMLIASWHEGLLISEYAYLFNKPALMTVKALGLRAKIDRLFKRGGYETVYTPEYLAWKDDLTVKGTGL